MSFLTHKMCLFGPSPCVLLQANEEYRFSGTRLHKLPKDSREQGHSCASLAALCPLPKESSLLFLPPCTGSEHHAVCPLPVRMSNLSLSEALVQHGGCATAGKQVLGRSSHPPSITTSLRAFLVMSLARRHLYPRL